MSGRPGLMSRILRNWGGIRHLCDRQICRLTEREQDVLKAYRMSEDIAQHDTIENVQLLVLVLVHTHVRDI